MSRLSPPPPERRRPPRRRASGSCFWRGVAQTLSIVASFVGAGVIAGSLAGGSMSPAVPRLGPEGFPGLEPYSALWMNSTSEREAEPEVWLIDGFNALHVALLRGRDRQEWWRGEERERLVAEVGRFDAGAAEVVVVFDGDRPLPEGTRERPGPRVVFAPSADDWLLKRVRESSAPERITLVTADRQLADRARHRGARVVAPRVFLDRCQERAGGSI